MTTLGQGPEPPVESKPAAQNRRPRRGLLLVALVAITSALAGVGLGLNIHDEKPVEGLASERVVAVFDDMFADFNRGDMNAFAAHFTQDAVWEEDGGTLQGSKRIAQAMHWLYDEGGRYDRDGVVIQNGHVASMPVMASMHAPGLVDVAEFDADWKIVHYWSHSG